MDAARKSNHPETLVKNMAWHVKFASTVILFCCSQCVAVAQQVEPNNTSELGACTCTTYQKQAETEYALILAEGRRLTVSTPVSTKHKLTWRLLKRNLPSNSISWEITKRKQVKEGRVSRCFR